MRPAIIIAIVHFVGITLPSADAQALRHTVMGTVTWQGLGIDVEAAGDVDADGVRDVVVGAPGTYQMYFLNGQSTGHAYVISGGNGAVIRTWSGGASDELFGAAVAAPGDVTGDGVPDICVGAPNVSTSTSPSGGAFYVFNGATGAIHTVVYGATNNYFGLRIATAADWNGDGFKDVVVDVPFGPLTPFPFGFPVAIVVSAATGQTLLSTVVVVPNASGGLWGTGGISATRDLSGDGIPDIAIGNYFGNIIWYFSGFDGSLMAAITPCAAPSSWTACIGGRDFAPIPDRDGDGFDDLIVGCPGVSTGTPNNGTPFVGQVRINTHTSPFPVAVVNGTVPNGIMGNSIATDGDFNGDGVNDILIGARQDADGYMNLSVLTTGPGYVRILSGTDLSTLATLSGPQFGCAFGHSVCFLGDLDGDGADEFAVGAPKYSVGSTQYCGAVFVYSGRTVSAADAGTVGLAMGTGPTDVLGANGTFGGLDRRVNVGIGQSFTLSMAQPPTMTAPSPFAIFGMVGLPHISTITPTAIGNFSILPSLLGQGQPWLFLLADNSSNQTSPLLASSPAPWATTVLGGVPVQLQVTLQGVVMQALTGIPANDYAVTNALVIVSP